MIYNIAGKIAEWLQSVKGLPLTWKSQQDKKKKGDNTKKDLLWDRKYLNGTALSLKKKQKS